ncbi:carboxypeptidase regulatory-like domain-containing protein [Micromonospora echinofusca]|uniref:alpha-amylase n=1 Tax=Micromonospora echinofusca TaxID=47858 RepID=A0ABS3VKT0_MICEH|nr:carboxypeptidase regulatory-like domain-containing protein [Micromonospora echinofusca]MBO4205125.1 hypothetical protein [Micromonospora echinofusca]
MTFPILRRVALAAALITAAAVLPGLPAYAAGTGAIAGTVTTSTGAAAPDVAVQVYLYDNGDTEAVGWATTDGQGRYRVSGLTTGLYLVGFQPPEGPQQFHPQTFDFAAAEHRSVSDGATTTVDELLSPTGVISGVIRNAAGTPVAGVPVTVEGAGTVLVTQTTTDADGRYRVVTAPDLYIVSFEPVTGTQQRQFVPGSLTYEAAGVFDLRAGGQLTADDTVLPTGTLAGRLTTASGGASVGAAVTATPVDGHDFVTVLTDANGEFSLPLFATGYVVSFYRDRLTQYYPGTTNHADATEVRVVAGQTIRITDSWLGTGAVRITGVDAVSGAPVADFCVESACSNGTGKVTVTGLPAGTQRLNADPADVLHFDTDLDVQVRADQTVDVTARFAPGAAISTRVVDRATGNPVSGVCLLPMRPKRVDMPDGVGECSDSAGRITVGPLRQDTYRLFAFPRNKPGYGQQWVGPTGGTGDERLAAAVPAVAGRVTAAPEVRLDPAGVIAGRVTDTAGQPLAGLGVGILPNTPGVHNQAETGVDGRYRLTGVGPYAWPVTIEGSGHSHWSGGTGDRYAASTVTVTAGATVTYDTTFRGAVTITGTIRNQSGVAAGNGRILAHNVTTGDVIGWGTVGDGRYSVPAIAGQSVYLTWSAEFGGVMRSGQYPEPASVRSTRPGGPTLATAGFPVPSTGPLTIDITVRTS